MKPWKAAVLTALFAVLSSAPLFSEDDNETCFSCHGQKIEGIPFVDDGHFKNSVHGRNLCVSCHTDAKEVPHPEKLASVNCGACHRIETQIYLNSDHGKALSRGKTQAATCTSCHGQTHTILSSRNPKSPVHRENLPQTCAACHSDEKKMESARLSEIEPYDSYLASIHGKAFKEGHLNAAICSDCHGTHDLHGAANPDSKIFRRNVPETCGKCHENVKQVFNRSIHGKASLSGIKESPVCTDCHGEHTIRAIKDPASSVYTGTITKTCSHCHESERIAAKFGMPDSRLETFEKSYHGLAAKGGDLRVANCSSCHGWHDVLPSYDPQSSVHPNNLAQTCGKCHQGAQANLVHGSIHGEDKADQYVVIKYVRFFYLFLILATIGFMLLHNFADYVRKAMDPGTGLPAAHGRILRMNLNERVQHGFLLIAFLTLAYSGFALKYPESWWASPFHYAGGEILRKGIHRWTALIFCVLGLYHFAYMAFTRRGRFLLKYRLLPRWRDAVQGFRYFGYNLGWFRTRPELSYPSYIEKMEYWALLWGTLIMVATGALLVFNDYLLKNLPLWVADLATLIHFYEAVLACLSILVWHFYWSIFDPEMYPMNLAWLTGRAKKVSKHEKTDEKS